jgi:hypothetical protein
MFDYCVVTNTNTTDLGDWSLLRGIRALATEHALARPPVVTTLTAAGMGEENGVRIEFIPTSLHCYTIARNVLRMEV